MRVGLWPRRAAADLAQVTEAVDTASRQSPVSAVIDAAADARASAPVTVARALQVPAAARAVALYRGVIGSFPLVQYAGTPPAPRVDRGFLRHPDPWVTTQETIAGTVQDLVLHGRAWWVVTDDAWDGFPSAVRHVPAEQVTEVPGRDPSWDRPIGIQAGDRSWTYPAGKASRGTAIRFAYGIPGGVLGSCGAALAAALALEDATFRYADNPVPQTILRNTGADLDDDQVDALLDHWEDARRVRATAYLNATVNLEAVGLNPSDLQLVDARNTAALQVARAFSLDPVWVGAGVSGSSLTYQNRVDLYRQLLDLSLAPVMAAVAARLSMDDVTPRGHTVAFDTSRFLRDDPAAVSAFLATVMPLGLVTTDEGRALLDMPPLDTEGTPG